MNTPKNKPLWARMILRILMFPVFMALLVLLPAGTWDYPEAYTYFGTLTLPLIVVMAYFYRKDPSLLEKRMKTDERRSSQKVFVFFASFSIIAAFVVPGLDKRFGWTDLPVWAIVAADILVLLSYFFIVYVFKTNSFASRVVEIQQDQQVVTSGPYAVVRHPMYTGMIVLYTASPVALGSLWGILPAALLIPALILRILNEEQLLKAELKGYEAYCKKQRFRLIPGIW